MNGYIGDDGLQRIELLRLVPLLLEGDASARGAHLVTATGHRACVDQNLGRTDLNAEPGGVSALGLVRRDVEVLESDFVTYVFHSITKL